jgi:hypothetical protein
MRKHNATASRVTYLNIPTAQLHGSIMYPVDQIIGGLMPNKVYMPAEIRPGGGTAFFMSWERLERTLRGEEGQPVSAIHSDETCDFVVEEHGITVYVEKKR